MEGVSPSVSQGCPPILPLFPTPSHLIQPHRALGMRVTDAHPSLRVTLCHSHMYTQCLWIRFLLSRHTISIRNARVHT